MVENNISDDMIYNWRNELRAHKDGVYVVANSTASKLKNQGFNKSEVIELLAANNYDIELANRVASNLFDENPNVEQNSTVEVAVVPTKYSDCAPIIEKNLQKLSAKEFTKRLCTGPYAIVKTDDRGITQWQRWASMAKESEAGMQNLHSALKPYIEEQLLYSVLTAQSEQAEIKTASQDRYIVSMKKGTAEVDLMNGTSTSDKYVQGSYSSFGLVDEFLVKAADTVSPYMRLKRAIVD